MTWPFENDTSAITKKLAKKSLKSEKRRNLMVVIAVALAAFLICFTGIVSTSLTQMQRNQVVDTYEAVWLGVEETDIETLKGVPEFERVGGYYMLGEELSEQGYHASYVYCDAQMMEITKAQMNLLEGRVPEKANEVVVSEYFLSTTIYLWLISLTASKELSILLLKLYNDGAIGISFFFPGLRVRSID